MQNFLPSELILFSAAFIVSFMIFAIEPLTILYKSQKTPSSFSKDYADLKDSWLPSSNTP